MASPRLGGPRDTSQIQTFPGSGVSLRWQVIALCDCARMSCGRARCHWLLYTVTALALPGPLTALSMRKGIPVL